MKRSSRPARTSAKLSNSLHRKLNMYALAATATGVSALALAQSTEAKIIYTPAHVKLLAGEPFPIDLNHDGVVDFYLLNYYVHDLSSHVLSACQFIYSFSHGPFCAPRTGANAIRATKSDRWAAALQSGATIEPADRFVNGRGVTLGGVSFLSFTHPVWRGPWMNGGKGVKNRYLGLKFRFKEHIHFGWARISVTTDPHSPSFTATLTGYAYETIPRKGIVAGATKEPDNVEPTALNQSAPKPAMLGALALGAPGLAIWRREESVGRHTPGRN
jgi:hypothetical protein